MNNEKRTPKINETIEGKYKLIDWKYINDFAILTTDLNPIHVDMDYIIKETVYNDPIAHGQIGVSLICALLGNTFKGILMKSQSLNFLKPITINTKVKPIIRCLSIKKVNEIYDNLEITFLVKLIGLEEKVFIAGKMIMFVWGGKK
jgi:acyl dehydratase